MKIKKNKTDRRSLALGELSAQARLEAEPEIDVAEGNQDENMLDVPEEKKPKLRRSLGGKVEKRQSSRLNKWSLLDMLGFGSKKSKSRKSMQPELIVSDHPTSHLKTFEIDLKVENNRENQGDAVGRKRRKSQGNFVHDTLDENKSSDSFFGIKNKHFGSKGRSHLQSITSNDCTKDSSLSENSLTKKVPQSDKDNFIDPTRLRQEKQKAITGDKNISQTNTNDRKGPKITEDMISDRKRSLRQTPLSPIVKNVTKTFDNPHLSILSVDRKPPLQPRNTTKCVSTPHSGIPLRSPQSKKQVDLRRQSRVCPSSKDTAKANIKPKSDSNSTKARLVSKLQGKGSFSSADLKQSKYRNATKNSSNSRKSGAVHNIRYAGSTPPRSTRRQSVGSAGVLDTSTKSNTLETIINTRHSKAYNPSISLRYFDDEDSTVNESQLNTTQSSYQKDVESQNPTNTCSGPPVQNEAQKQDVIPLTMDELEALDMATKLPGTAQKLGVPKRESLVEALKTSPLLSPERYFATPVVKQSSSETTKEKYDVTNGHSGGRSRTRLFDSVSSSLSRGLRSSKSSIMNLRTTRKSRTPQSAEQASATPTTSHFRASLKRAHSISVTTNVASLRCPDSPMMTPMSSVAHELQMMKTKKRRKERTLEEIIKEHTKSRKGDDANKKPPPKPPRKLLKTRLSTSRGRLRRKSKLTESPDAKEHKTERTSVKRKSSIREMLKRKPPPKPARRSLNTPQKSTDNSSSDTDTTTTTTGYNSTTSTTRARSASIGAGMRKLRRKLSRAGDFEAVGRATGAQMPVFNAGHTPKPPRGRKDERLV